MLVALLIFSYAPDGTKSIITTLDGEIPSVERDVENVKQPGSYALDILETITNVAPTFIKVAGPGVVWDETDTMVYYYGLMPGDIPPNRGFEWREVDFSKGSLLTRRAVMGGFSEVNKNFQR